MFKIIKETSKTLTINLKTSYANDYNITFKKAKDEMCLLEDANKVEIFCCKKDEIEQYINQWIHDNNKQQPIDLFFHLQEIKYNTNRQKRLDLVQKRNIEGRKLDIKPNDVLVLYKGSGGYHGLQIKKFIVEEVFENYVSGWYYDNGNKTYYCKMEYSNIKKVLHI